MGTLFVVATPIGNLNDISRRALEILGSVDLIACEDTRQTIKLLHHFGIRKPLTSYHEFNEEQKAQELAARLAGGTTIALVSDAGTPLLADPGFRLVRICRERQIPVVTIPGPNAAIAALAASGLPASEFTFLGFLPSKKQARRQKLSEVAGSTRTLVFYEAPHRIEATLQDMEEILGDREACVARELTKVHEEFLFGKISEIRTRINAIGEFVVIVGGAREPREPQPVSREEVLRKLGMTRNQLYDLLFRKKDAE